MWNWDKFLYDYLFSSQFSFYQRDTSVVWKMKIGTRRLGAHPEFFDGGGVGCGGEADPEAIYNLCLILKIQLSKSRCKQNITLSATAFIYIRI
jgi:hypothetical protein